MYITNICENRENLYYLTPQAPDITCFSRKRKIHFT